MPFTPNVNSGDDSPEEGGGRLGPKTRRAQQTEEDQAAAAATNEGIEISDPSQLEVAYYDGEGWESSKVHEIVNSQSTSTTEVSPVYKEKTLNPGSADSFLLKSQADRLYGAAQGESSFLTVDAADGDTVRTLPEGEGALVVIRTDGTSNTATLTHTSSIVTRSGELSTIDIGPDESMEFFGFDGQWYLVDDTLPVGLRVIETTDYIEFEWNGTVLFKSNKNNQNFHSFGEVEAFSDGSGTSVTTYSELQVLDDGNSLTTDAKSIDFKGGVTLTNSSGDITVDVTDGGVNFQAGNQLTFDTGTSPQTLDVVENGLDADTLDGKNGAEYAAIGDDEDIFGQWTFNVTPVIIGDTTTSHTWGTLVVDGADSLGAVVVEEDGGDKAVYHTQHNGIDHGWEFSSQDFSNFSRFLFRSRDANYWYDVIQSEMDTSGGDITTKIHANKHANATRNFGAVTIGSNLSVDEWITGSKGYKINAAGGRTAELTGTSTNTNTGVALRMDSDNVNSDDNIFTVESTGSSSRFGVTQNNGAWIKDGLQVGSDYNGGVPDPGDGNIVADGEIEAFDSSDRRLKTNLSSINNPLSTLDTLTGYSFDWNNEAPDYKPDSGYGLVAQEVRDVMPEAVRENADGYLGLQYEQIIPLLVEGIKANDRRIQKAESKVKELQNRVSELESRLNI